MSHLPTPESALHSVRNRLPSCIWIFPRCTSACGFRRISPRGAGFACLRGCGGTCCRTAPTLAFRPPLRPLTAVTPLSFRSGGGSAQSAHGRAAGCGALFRAGSIPVPRGSRDGHAAPAVLRRGHALLPVGIRLLRPTIAALARVGPLCRGPTCPGFLYRTRAPFTKSWIAPAAKPAETTESVPPSVLISSRSNAVSG